MLPSHLPNISNELFLGQNVVSTTEKSAISMHSLQTPIVVNTFNSKARSIRPHLAPNTRILSSVANATTLQPTKNVTNSYLLPNTTTPRPSAIWQKTTRQMAAVNATISRPTIHYTTSTNRSVTLRPSPTKRSTAYPTNVTTSQHFVTTTTRYYPTSTRNITITRPFTAMPRTTRYYSTSNINSTTSPPFASTSPATFSTTNATTLRPYTAIPQTTGYYPTETANATISPHLNIITTSQPTPNSSYTTTNVTTMRPVVPQLQNPVNSASNTTTWKPIIVQPSPIVSTQPQQMLNHAIESTTPSMSNNQMQSTIATTESPKGGSNELIVSLLLIFILKSVVLKNILV